MKFPRLFLLVLALGFTPVEAAENTMLGTAAAANAHWHFLNAQSVDLKRVLPQPPAPGSPAAEADLETILQVQAARTPEQVAWAQSIEQDDFFKFSAVIGPWFSATNLPFTATFFQEVTDDSALASRDAKILFNRPRPPNTDPRVHVCVEVPASSSYPSGHAIRVWTWATILAEIFPQQREALFERARAVAWGRVIGGVHFPSDIMAGKILGQRIGEELLKNPAAQAAIKKAQTEAEPFLLKKAA